MLIIVTEIMIAVAASQDLSGARVTTVGYINEVPQTCIELVEGTRNHRFGEALSAVEQQWLARRINEHVKVSHDALLLCICNQLQRFWCHYQLSAERHRVRSVCSLLCCCHTGFANVTDCRLSLTAAVFAQDVSGRMGDIDKFLAESSQAEDQRQDDMRRRRHRRFSQQDDSVRMHACH